MGIEWLAESLREAKAVHLRELVLRFLAADGRTLRHFEGPDRCHKSFDRWIDVWVDKAPSGLGEPS